jgi:NAD(P)-dependent dehydrogenase (short-subunit alcohol dehydrogenase family)
VTTTGRYSGRLAAVAELSGLGPLPTYAGDAAKVDQARTMAEHAVAEQGRVDCLFRSVGVPGVAALEQLDEDLRDHEIDINLKGPRA